MMTNFVEEGKVCGNLGLALIETIYIFLVMMGITPPPLIELGRSMGVICNYIKGAASAEEDRKKKKRSEARMLRRSRKSLTCQKRQSTSGQPS